MSLKEKAIKLLAEVWVAGNVSDITPNSDDLPHKYFDDTWFQFLDLFSGDEMPVLDETSLEDNEKAVVDLKSQKLPTLFSHRQWALYQNPTFERTFGTGASFVSKVQKVASTPNSTML